MPENLLDLLDKLDLEHSAMRVTGTAAGPLLNARAIVVEMRRLIRGDYDSKRDTSQIPKLEADDGDPIDDG